ncbi:MAG: Ig-like domain-containing protein, partial [Tyzzerella sp.]|nr:Ig-like domain-containing protein [Tyzzerella sp.]
MNYSQKMWKRILSMVLAVAIVLTMLPVSETYAATPGAVELVQPEVTLKEIKSTKNLHISAVYNDATEPQAVEEYTAEWSSEDINIATVSGNGNVTAVGAGKTKINVTAKYTDTDGNEKSSSGYATVEVYVTPTVQISATPSSSVKYPTEVTFDVVAEPKSEGKKELSIVKEGETNPISYTIGQPIKLEVGKYTVSASVGADGYYKSASAESMTYEVAQAEEAGTAISIPEEINCGESFDLVLPTQQASDGTKLDGTYKIDITGLDASGKSLENVKPNETITLTAGEEPTTAKIDITFTPEDSNYAKITYSTKNVSVKAIPVKQPEISLDKEVYWQDKIELVLPELTTEEGNQKVDGKYSVSVTDLDAVDENGQKITNLTSMDPTTIYLNANTVTEEAKVKISFKPDSKKYADVEYSEVTINVKPIPVVATWDDHDLFVKDYDAEGTLTINDGPTLSFAEEYKGNADKPTLVEREMYVFNLDDPNVGKGNATLAEKLELKEDNYKLVDENPTVTVTVNPIVLEERNIAYEEAQGKSFDANAAAVVNLKLNNGNNKFIKDEFEKLTVSYTAEYYKDEKPESGDSEKDVDADKIIISDIKIVDENGKSNYEPSTDKIVINGPFTIAKNAGFLDFVNDEDLKTQFGSPVEEGGIETYWFSKDETKNISSTGFKFSDELDGSWSESYTVANTTPTKIYAKNEAGLISGGIYVALDETAPSNGQIFAKTAESNTVISVQDLSNKFEKLTGGENIEIVFAGSDNESKISTIEWYGSNIAWDENNKDAWDKIDPEDPIYVNEKSDKDNNVEQQIEFITSQQDLKRFYYARI